MKMVSELLQGVDGIRAYYIAGLLIFLVLFVVLLVRTLRMPAKDANRIKNSILNDNENPSSSKT